MIFDTMGFPPNNKYVFLGNGIGKGQNSLESICLLFIYFLLYPECVTILRGRNESGPTTMMDFMCTFYKKISKKLFAPINITLNYSPCAAIINNNVLCCHNDIFPHVKDLDLPAGAPCLLASESFEPSRFRNITWLWSNKTEEEFLCNSELKLQIKDGSRDGIPCCCGYPSHAKLYPVILGTKGNKENDNN